MVILCDKPFEETDNYSQYFERFSNFKLSDFQKWAIKAIVDGDKTWELDDNPETFRPVVIKYVCNYKITN